MDSVPPELQVEAPEGPCDSEASNSVNMQALVQQLRAEAAQQIEAAVSNVWNKGLKGLQQAQEKRAAQNAALEAELRTFKGRQEWLTQENLKLRGAVESLVRSMSGLAPYNPASGLGEGSEFFTPAQTPAAVAAAAATLLQASDSHVSNGLNLFHMTDTPSESQAGDALMAPAESLKIPEALKIPGGPTSMSRESSAGTVTTQSSTPTASKGLGVSSPVDAELTKAQSSETIFRFTLRKADGVPLGLDVSHAKGGRCLRVENIQAGGAVDAWNRQCPKMNPEAETREVLPGDTVVAVNNVSGEPSAMLAECRTRQLLRMTISRVARDKQKMPPGCSPPGLERGMKQSTADDAAGQQPLQFSKFGA